MQQKVDAADHATAQLSSQLDSKATKLQQSQEQLHVAQQANKDHSASQKALKTEMRKTADKQAQKVVVDT